MLRFQKPRKMTQDVVFPAHPMIHVMPRMIVTCKNSQVEIPLEAAEFGGPEVGGQDLLGEELAVRDGEGAAGRAPRDERIAIAGCGGWRCGGEEERFVRFVDPRSGTSSGVSWAPREQSPAPIPPDTTQ